MVKPFNRYCEVALPVPIQQTFTYQLFSQPAKPQAVQDVAPGCRVLVPFSGRKLIGVVLSLHNRAPSYTVRSVERILDSEPVLSSHLLSLGEWISQYYCVPLGEVLRSMVPLAGEMRRARRYVVTEAGVDAGKGLFVADNATPHLEILTMLLERPRSAEYLRSKVEGARDALKDLMKEGLVAIEEDTEERDPMRSPAEKLHVEFLSRPAEGVKLPKNERELLAYLELHPGSHNVAQIGEMVKNAGKAARSLARRELVKLERETPPISRGYERERPDLNLHQQAAVDAVENALRAQTFTPFLLQGVTGSGKTEVYMRCIEATLALGRNALLLVPEIALTPAVAGQFFHRFGDQVAILHSAFGEVERAGQWRRIQHGLARVIVGTRSGVFAPVQNLGLLIVDEEHDGSYKQGEAPRYHGRDVALVRGKEAGAVVLLGSATPSIESRYNCDLGKYTRLLMPERIGNRPMPTVEVVDMRAEFLETKKQATFSRRMQEEIGQRLGAGEQCMLLLNRRGFSSFMVCRACGERLTCPNCAVSLTFHRKDRRMLCHYCNHAEKVPELCPHCGSDHIQFLGTGSERVEDELHQLFPTARIARLDRDTASSKGAYERILQTFRAGDLDILVGTQMIAKGHDIANVTLVGVVLADIGLSMPDFRAAERSFQLLTQAAGRAGRGLLPGHVLIQTLNPEHYAIQLAVEHDYESFYKKETEFRRWLSYPPYASMANIILRAEKQETALRFSTEFGRLLTPAPSGVRVLGPAEAPVPRLKAEFRYQLLLKAQRRSQLREMVQKLLDYAAQEKWPATSVVIDVDPLSLM